MPALADNHAVMARARRSREPPIAATIRPNHLTYGNSRPIDLHAWGILSCRRSFQKDYHMSEKIDSLAAVRRCLPPGGRLTASPRRLPRGTHLPHGVGPLPPPVTKPRKHHAIVAVRRSTMGHRRLTRASPAEFGLRPLGARGHEANEKMTSTIGLLKGATRRQLDQCQRIPPPFVTPPLRRAARIYLKEISAADKLQLRCDSQGDSSRCHTGQVKTSLRMGVPREAACRGTLDRPPM